jgi:hypothetical protein
MLPESFRMAVRRHLVGGVIEVATGDGPRLCKHEDWIVHGPDGQFSVQRAAMFETWFEEAAAPPVETLQPTPASLPVKRSKERTHA